MYLARQKNKTMNKYKIETYVSSNLMPVEYAETWREVKRIARKTKKNKDLCRNFPVTIEVSLTDEYKKFLCEKNRKRRDK